MRVSFSEISRIATEMSWICPFTYIFFELGNGSRVMVSGVFSVFMMFFSGEWWDKRALAALRGGNERDLVVRGKLACGPLGFRDYRLVDGYGDAFAGRKQLG